MRFVTLIIAVIALAIAAPAIADKGGIPNGGDGNGGNAGNGGGTAAGGDDTATDATPSPPSTSGVKGPTADPGKTMGTIWVTGSEPTLGSSSAVMGNDFTVSGCGFRTSSDNYFLVVRGPGVGTSLAYWYDGFRTDGNGCGSKSPSWAGSGVAGDFDVYVVSSGSGQPWKGQLASNVVTITITDS